MRTSLFRIIFSLPFYAPGPSVVLSVHKAINAKACQATTPYYVAGHGIQFLCFVELALADYAMTSRYNHSPHAE